MGGNNKGVGCIYLVFSNIFFCELLCACWHWQMMTIINQETNWTRGRDWCFGWSVCAHNSVVLAKRWSKVRLVVVDGNGQNKFWSMALGTGMEGRYRYQSTCKTCVCFWKMFQWLKCIFCQIALGETSAKNGFIGKAQLWHILHQTPNESFATNLNRNWPTS